MHIAKKMTGKASGIPIGLAAGALISLVITFAGAATTAYLVAKEKIGEGSIGYAAMLIAVVAAAMGAWCAFSAIKRRRMQICMLSGGVYFGTLLAMTALFFGGRYQGMWATLLSILVGCGIVALFPTKSSTKIRRKKRGYR